MSPVVPQQRPNAHLEALEMQGQDASKAWFGGGRMNREPISNTEAAVLLGGFFGIVSSIVGVVLLFEHYTGLKIRF